MFTLPVTLKTGRKVVLRESNAADNLKILKMYGEDFPPTHMGAAIAMGMAQTAMTVVQYQKRIENDSKNPTFHDQLHVREHFKVYKTLENFWSRFSFAEQEELAKYSQEMNSEDTPNTEEEVDALVEDSTEGKT